MALLEVFILCVGNLDESVADRVEGKLLDVQILGPQE